MLRVSASSPPDAVARTLRRAGSILFRLYPDSLIYAQVTANAVLQSTKESSFSLYFGQRFAESKELHHPAGEDKSEVFELEALSDVARLPTQFPTAAFKAIFESTFANSDVRVERVVNIVYLFSKALRRFSADKQTAGQKWVSLF